MSENKRNEEDGQRPRRKRKMSKDIAPILKGWDYESGTINVRKVIGLDGVPKLQMRLDLGLLQMEMNGRPDGETPHGCESLLDYYERRLNEYKHEHGNELGFVITPDECEALRGEAVMYYHRYLSLLVLEEFDGVVRDTARNIRVIDFCGQFAEDEQDRLVLEQYRPYITMMNARAGASILFKQKKYREALTAVEDGLSKIREFFARFGQEDVYNESNEVKVLKRFARDIRKKLPVDPLEKLQRQLDRAVEEERYEDAARLRDEINAIRVQSEK